MDAEETALVLRAREIDKDRERRLFAGLVAELRNLGLSWSSTPAKPWTIEQVLGEQPRSAGAPTNSMSAIEARIREDEEAREQQARADADGWFESLDPPSLCIDDDDLEVLP
jgi:hypothetical protein